MTDDIPFKQRYPGTGPPCCVCGDPSLNMTHEADGDGRRYCSPACVAAVHPLSPSQVSRLRLLLGIDQIDVRPRPHKKEKPKLHEWEIDRMINDLPRVPGPNAKDWSPDSTQRTTVHCIVCGEEFKTYRSHTQFCSNRCSVRHRRQKKAEPKDWDKVRAVQEELMASLDIEETVVKTQRHPRVSYSRVCPCGQEFVAHRVNTKFCSKPCRDKHWREHHGQTVKAQEVVASPRTEDRARLRLELLRSQSS